MTNSATPRPHTAPAHQQEGGRRCKRGMLRRKLHLTYIFGRRTRTNTDPHILSASIAIGLKRNSTPSKKNFRTQNWIRHENGIRPTDFMAISSPQSIASLRWTAGLLDSGRRPRRQMSATPGPHTPPPTAKRERKPERDILKRASPCLL